MLVTVQDWLRELHVLHNENISHRELIAQLQQENAQLKDKNSLLEKTDTLLANSLRQISFTNEALLGPMK